MSSCLICFIVVTISTVSARECNLSNENITTFNCSDLGDSRFDSCDLSNYINSFTTVLLPDKEIKLNQTLTFKSLRNVSLVGNHTIINCQNESNTMMVFINITNLCLQKVTFRQCGGHFQIANASHGNQHGDRSFFGTIVIIRTINVFLKKVAVDQSNGGGMYLGNVSESVTITESNFTRNPQDITCCINKRRYGGGIYIDQVRTETPAKPANIIIEKCVFTDNNIQYSTKKIDRRYTNHGGGVYASIKAQGNHLAIKSCNINNNRAGYGGGMAITISNCSYNTTVLVTNSNFSNNVVKGTFAQSGGGLVLNFEPPLAENDCTINKIEVTLDGNNFKGNTAWIGGGLVMIGFCQGKEIQITIRNSHWIENQARSGAAVAVLRSLKDQGQCHSFPTIELNSCTFEENSNNRLITTSIPDDDGPLYYLEGWTGPGIFFVINFDVTFSGQNIFRSNINTALSSINCILYFQNTNTIFENNTGEKGGAIDLQGLSHIDINNALLTFENNDATKTGGAIHSHLVVEATIISAASCFIQNSKAPIPSRWKSTIIFRDNFAKITGHSIYVSSLLPCQIAYGIQQNELLDVTQILNDTNIFIFEGSSFEEQVSTSPVSIDILKHDQDSFTGFPGEEFNIPVTFTDSLGRNVTNVTVQFEMSFDNTTVLYNSKEMIIKLMGKNKEEIDIQIKSTHNPHISKNISVMLTACPLGYKLNKNICQCNIIDDHNAVQCSPETFSLKTSKGNFVGVINGNIVTSFCPTLFCSPNTETSTLPVQYKDEIHLEKYICSENRKGILCGECAEGYTTYYNSPNFLCKKETSACDIGWVYYILSTLLPLTLIFITVTAFDINLTIGSLRGFLLFCQVVIIIDWDSGSISNKITRVIWKMIYDIFRLRFFYIDYFSFCLKRKATTLDVLSFQYISTAYAILLVCGSLFFLSYCTVHFNKFCSCIRFTTFKHSFVTGMSALLILCYGSMATISMNILNTATLYDHNRKKFGETRVNLQGNYIYFSYKHLPYALPALLFLSTIVLTPIILFLSCPLVNKCFDYFKMTNSNKASRIASQCYVGGKLKPFYDTFQGCFKEKAQFFAGMYFLYQIMVIISKIYPTTRHQTFFHTSLTLVIILAIHSFAQPYKERLHNIIDTLLFTNLVVINSLSYYIYLAEINPEAHFNGTEAANIIRTILILSPLIAFFVVILKSICKNCNWYHTIRHNALSIYKERRLSTIEWERNKYDNAYGAIESEDDDSDLSASVRKRQFSLSSFIAHEQTLTPIDSV